MSLESAPSSPHACKLVRYYTHPTVPQKAVRSLHFCQWPLRGSDKLCSFRSPTS